MSSDDDEDNLSWDMLDDRKFVMWPGYKFPSPMSYKEMCSQVNMEATQPVGMHTHGFWISI